MINIEKLKKEQDDLARKIQDPSLSKEPGAFKRVSTRLSELEEIINTYNEIKDLQNQIEEAQELIKSSDEDMKKLAQDELKVLNEKIKTLNSKIEELTIEKDPNDYRNVLIEIRAGTGGDEAALFAENLYRMYLKYAERMGWKVEEYSSSRTGNGGYKEVIALFSGDNAYGELKLESGVHRVQRVPVTESSGRIHTSTASVVVLPEIEDLEVEVKDEDLKIDVFRAGGPGGQSVNTTDSAVRITHLPSGLVVSVQDEKSQLKNKAKAIKILKSRLYDMKLAEEEKRESEKRKNAMKGGDRSAKIRTYNFPQSRITDHRIKKSWHNMQSILGGDLEEIIKTTGRELNTQK
ncbi:peptide chain release factor 1 [Candidatus Dojkabacteria bacterium]|nr:peptide chain release factor 1 [Candidatus Dojkabacteria bacterium]